MQPRDRPTVRIAEPWRPGALTCQLPTSHCLANAQQLTVVICVVSVANFVGNGVAAAEGPPGGLPSGSVIGGRYRIEQALGSGRSADRVLGDRQRDRPAPRVEGVPPRQPRGGPAGQRRVSAPARARPPQHRARLGPRPQRRRWALPGHRRSAGPTITSLASGVHGGAARILPAVRARSRRRARVPARPRRRARRPVAGERAPRRRRAAGALRLRSRGPRPRQRDGGATGTLGYAAPRRWSARAAPRAICSRWARCCTRPGPARRRSASASRRAAHAVRRARRSCRRCATGWRRRGTRSSPSCSASAPADRHRRARASCCARSRAPARRRRRRRSMSICGAPHPEGDPLAGIFVGRRLEREALRAALERLAEGAVARSVVAVVGSPGSGRRTLIESARCASAHRIGGADASAVRRDRG